MPNTRSVTSVISVVFLFSVSLQANASDPRYPGQPLAHIEWSRDIPAHVTMESRKDSLEFSDILGRRAATLKVLKNADYSKIANGSARSEIQLAKAFRFKQGKTYTINWSTYIPSNFDIDDKNFVIFTQIHQGDRSGAPTLAITILGENYAISQRGGEYPQKISAGKKFCCVSDDKGKWVNWKLMYKPVDDGPESATVLWKDGSEIFNVSGKPNAYLGDNEAYLKFGLYKPHWNDNGSQASEASISFGPITIIKSE